MAVEKEKAPSKLSSTETFLLSLVGGGIGACAGKTALAPIDRVKLLLQNQGEMLKQGTISRPYSGAIDCTMQIFRNEGLISFWRGNLASCIKYFPTQNKNHSYMVNFSKNVASGGVAGALSLCFVYSLEYARTRLANDVKSTMKGGGERKYNGLVDVYRKTLATDGIVGLYRGFGISCVGIFIYRGCYFGLYDTLKPIILGPDSGLKLSYLLGYGVTLTSGLISYPLDTIQRRMMMTSGQAVKYKGAMDCMFQIIRNEGTIALFKGFGVVIFRIIPSAGLLPAFDKLVQLYIGVKPDTRGGG
ncbi:unnamed protein product [Didymodactylos carnosus]|uniref:ADP/ATP translocase n=1 Tax=Didymodactylos carnosus TaxID=1234261 RepID=A0A815FXP1_9BILA|nr:unnamed protein product [Didymodactylos carnosus]CAF1331328.1 unnamed protein product [Didymodactylos carnosus]CAF3738855.1 unnamed protein product [Didymodactylos carnosus]CAF4185064.1 unnamed protein product [Didymodactylos carnosus]